MTDWTRNKVSVKPALLLGPAHHPIAWIISPVVHDVAPFLYDYHPLSSLYFSLLTPGEQKANHFVPTVKEDICINLLYELFSR